MLDLLALPVVGLLAQGAGAAAASPTWTDKEVLIAVGSVVGTLLTVGVPVVLFLVRRAGARSRERVRKGEGEREKLREEIIRLQQELQKITEGTVRGKLNLHDMELQVRQAQEEVQELEASNLRVEEQAAAEHHQVEQLKANLNTLQGQMGSYGNELEAERRRIEKALRKDGQTWTEKVLSNAPEFKKLQPESRRTPIISVLNLKGGVGKTTIAANLGAAFDGVGYRVLLLDLDLQGSLTSLFLSESRQAELHARNRLIGDFFAATFDAEFPNLLDYAEPIQSRGESGLVPTTDQLAYAEMNLTIRWLLREGNRDPRFMLRRELHLKRIMGRYDIVLLDCPPLINVSCVNALAASDYVLAPILPSKQATARVPILLRRLKDFRDNINSDLNVLGILANRTHRSELTLEEQNRLTALRAQCKDIWGLEVPLFDTFVRQNREVRAAEDDHRPLRKGDEMYETFIELAREVQERLPTFCRPALRRQATPQEVAS